MDIIKVLIVEDEAIVAMDISRTLKDLGYRVLAICRSAEDALGLLDKEIPDIVLMDVHIQGNIDGIELAINLYRDKRLPIIFLTSHSDDKTLERATLAEPYGYLSKSFYYKDIRATIVTALKNHRMKLLVEEQEELLSLTLGNIDEAVITTDSQGEILFYNQGAVNLFHLNVYSPDTALKEFPKRGFSLRNKIGKVVENPLQQKDLPDRLFLSRPNWGDVPLDCRVNHYWGAGNSRVERVYLFRDVSQEFKMQEVSARLTSLIQFSEDAIAMISPGGFVISWNRGAEGILGIDEMDAAGRNLNDLLPHFHFPDWGEQMNGTFIPNRTLEGMHRHPQGGTKSLSAILSAVWNSEGLLIGYSFIARDITPRIQLERQIIEAEDNERRRIGRDLHDSLGQQLTGISLMIKALQNNFDQGRMPQAREVADGLGELIKSAIKETRELSRGLVPEILRDEGFLVALKDLALYYERVMGVEVQCRTEDLGSLDDGVDIQLYHIAQEALNNAVKHGEAAKITVGFFQGTDGIVLQVRDNGKGFNHEEIERGLGLNNMRYRADIINGKLRVDSNQGEGTLVECILM